MEDNFNKILSDKFQNYKPPVPEHLWANIEPQIQKEHKDRGGLLFLGLSLIVVSLMFGVYHSQKAFIGNVRTSIAHNNRSLHQSSVVSTSSVGQVCLSDHHNVIAKTTRTGKGASGTLEKTKDVFSNVIEEEDEQIQDLNPLSTTKYTKPDQSIVASGSDLNHRLNYEGETINTNEEGILWASLGGNYSESNSDTHSTIDKYGMAVMNKTRFKKRDPNTSSTLTVSDENATLFLNASVSLNDSSRKESEELPIPLPSPKTEQRTKKKMDPDYKHAIQLSFSPLKVSNTNSGVDQGYEIAGTYGKNFSKRWNWSVGCSYISMGTPLHYEVPQSTVMTIAPYDPTKLGNGNQLTTNDSLQYIMKTTANKEDLALQSMNVIGLSLGFGYHIPLHKKWNLETGLTINPSLVIKTSHTLTNYSGTSAYENKMGTKGFNALGLSSSGQVTIAYRPIKKAELLCGMRINYFAVSLHKSEQMRPLGLGPVFGLRWLF